MPEAGVKKFRYYEMVPKGTGHRLVEQKLTITSSGAVPLMSYFFNSERFAIHTDDCKKHMTSKQQKEAFGDTLTGMERAAKLAEEKSASADATEPDPVKDEDRDPISGEAISAPKETAETKVEETKVEETENVT